MVTADRLSACSITVRLKHVLFCSGRELGVRDEDLVEEVCPNIDSVDGGASNLAEQDFSFEWTEDDHAELDYDRNGR